MVAWPVAIRSREGRRELRATINRESSFLCEISSAARDPYSYRQIRGHMDPSSQNTRGSGLEENARSPDDRILHGCDSFHVSDHRIGKLAGACVPANVARQ